jgi:chromosome transmission fidelity protein 4
VSHSRAYTGGEDCLVRIWTVADGSHHEPLIAAEAEKGITSISLSVRFTSISTQFPSFTSRQDDYWLSASMDADVRRYVKNSSKLDGLVTETKNVPVRCIAIDPRGKTVAVASESVLCFIYSLI